MHCTLAIQNATQVAFNSEYAFDPHMEASRTLLGKSSMKMYAGCYYRLNTRYSGRKSPKHLSNCPGMCRDTTAMVGRVGAIPTEIPMFELAAIDSLHS